MKYHGKLYGKLWDKYFDTTHTTDEWDAMENRIAELEKENQVLRKSDVIGQSELLIAFCNHSGIQKLVPTKVDTVEELVDEFLAINSL